LERGASEITSRMNPPRGFKSIVFLRDEQSGAMGALSLWESMEAVDAATLALERMTWWWFYREHRKRE
jgi:hypothetical protein